MRDITLTFSEVEKIRNLPGRSLLLFLTDRCPVGCAHCSVDSRPESPSITDFDLFGAILESICNRPELTTIGISGGEPFVERRGLTQAVERLKAAGKQIVLYTSGVWANQAVPDWVGPIIRQVSCVFLSTDAFHAASVDDERFVRAAKTVAAEGTWLVVQVLNEPQMVQRAERLLDQAFGARMAEYAEINLIPPLAYGRGENLFQTQNSRPGQSFGTCGALASPVVRYDGTIAACCNERVIMGFGPGRLRRQARTGPELTDALDDIAANPLLKVLGSLGAGALTAHPRFTDLAERNFSSICELCWAIHRRANQNDPAGEATGDRLLKAMAVLTRKG